MKRYIRASFDPSMPDWLKKAFNNKYAFNADKFTKNFGVSLSEAKFSDTPAEKSVPIYLLDLGNGTQVYVPGFNDDTTVYINNRARKLGSIAKSKLEDMTADIVYMDRLSAPLPKDHGYQDPRRYYNSRYTDKQGNYAGQYQRYNGEWSSAGSIGPTEVRARDKSGYVVPDPKEQLARYYDMFPEKVTDKVEKIYQRLLEVKDKVLSSDRINTPVSRDENFSITNAMYRLGDAINAYRELLRTAKSVTVDDLNSWSKQHLIQTVSSEIREISRQLDEAEKYLTSRW